MGILRIGVLAVGALLSAAAIFIGVVLLLTSLKVGSITMSYTSGADVITETVTRAGDTDRFWRLVMLMGVMPLVVGALSLWYTVRSLRRTPAG